MDPSIFGLMFRIFHGLSLLFLSIDGQEKVALSMHLSRVLYISKLPLVKSKVRRCDEDVFESPARWYDGEVYGSIILIYIDILHYYYDYCLFIFILVSMIVIVVIIVVWLLLLLLWFCYHYCFCYCYYYC